METAAEYWGLIPVVLVAGVAAYRLWRVAGQDTITEKLRVRLIENDSRVANFIFDLVICPWCLGFWISGAIALALGHQLDLSLLDTGLLWLATSTVAGVTANALDP